jgi:hypothetical protein
MTILPLLLLTLSPIQIDGSFSDWPEGIIRQADSNYEYALITLPSAACLQKLHIKNWPSQLVHQRRYEQLGKRCEETQLRLSLPAIESLHLHENYMVL